MRLVSFQLDTPLGPAIRLGVLTGDREVIDINAATRARFVQEGLAEAAAERLAAALTPARIVEFIEAGRHARDAAEQTIAGPVADQFRHDISALRLLPAVTGAPLLRDFLSFEGHLRNVYPRLGRQIPAEWYEIPAYYKGNTASLGADGDVITMPPYAEDLDFEFEFAAVIGRGGSDIAPDHAMDHIYGYTIYNDFSARRIQATEMAVGLGPAKSKDFHHAHVLGPYLVTADEVGDPYSLHMRAWVNDEQWVDDTSGGMHWRFDQMIAHASTRELIRPGEIFGSGTVAGGSAIERGSALHRGDTVTLEIAGLGRLRNTIG